MISYLGAFFSIPFAKVDVAGGDLGSREKESLQHTPVRKAHAVELLHEGNRVDLSCCPGDDKGSHFGRTGERERVKRVNGYRGREISAQTVKRIHAGNRVGLSRDMILYNMTKYHTADRQGRPMNQRVKGGRCWLCAAIIHPTVFSGTIDLLQRYAASSAK